MEPQTGNLPEVLVLGLGNLIMSDDGVGVKVVQRLEQGCRFPPNVRIMDGGTLGLDILPMLEGKSHLIVVDAVETGAVPGTLVRLEGDDIPQALETRVSPHQMGLKDLLSVARLMGHIPGYMVLIGVQPGRIDLGTELTQEVASRMERMAEMILDELKLLGVEVSAAPSSSPVHS